ncbi:MAG: MFS transporter [Microvirga sp.]
MQPGASPIAQVGTLIAATSIAQLANGFFTTFISLRVISEGFGSAATGIILSSYFLGFTIGAVWSTSLITRIGHIRAYAAFAALVVGGASVMPLTNHPAVWSAARALVGLGCSGLFVTTECWLNAKTEPSQRGRIFSLYMVGIFAALALGQALLAVASLDGARPFAFVSMLFSAALALVSLTRAEPPLAMAYVALRYGELAKAAPLAVAGTFLAGFISSTFYALVPAWMQGRGLEPSLVGLVMVSVVLGGLAFQVPVGRLSDRFDRRLVLLAVALGFAASAFLVTLVPRTLVAVLPVAAVIGGTMSTLYPLCVSHAHDRMPSDRVLAVSGRLILVSGIGSILGPLVGIGTMDVIGLNGVLYVLAAAGVVLAGLAYAESVRTMQLGRSTRPFEILTPEAAGLPHDVGPGAGTTTPRSVQS